MSVSLCNNVSYILKHNHNTYVQLYHSNTISSVSLYYQQFTSTPTPKISPPLPTKLVYKTSDDDSIQHQYEMSDDDSESDSKDMMLGDEFDEIDEEGKKERNLISNYLDNYAEGEDISFSGGGGRTQKT